MLAVLALEMPVVTKEITERNTITSARHIVPIQYFLRIFPVESAQRRSVSAVTGLTLAASIASAAKRSPNSSDAHAVLRLSRAAMTRLTAPFSSSLS